MPLWDSLTSAPAIIAAAVAGGAALVFINRSSAQLKQEAKEFAAATQADTPVAKMAQSAASVMSAPAINLAPPKSDPISVADLAEFNGSDPSKPIFVAIKGKVFDVSAKKDMYGPGAGYNVFAGKDASKGLGMSSLDPKDAIADYSGLDEKQKKTLDQWESFFEKRYNIVGQVKP